MIIADVEISKIWIWIVFASIVKYLHIVTKEGQKNNIKQLILHLSSSILAAYFFMSIVDAIDNGVKYQIPAALIGSLLGRTLIDRINIETFQPIIERVFNVKK